MNTELLLKLQSWVDGELSEAEARQVAELVRTDKEAAALATELKMTSGFLAGNELEVKLPESREFYWSKIERAIERAEAEAPERDAVPWLVALRRFLVPVSGFALVAFITVASIGVLKTGNHGAGTADDPNQYLVQEENLSTHVDTVSYKAKSENMFVVYVINKDEAADDDDADMDDDLDDAVIQ
jgi:anti-sigma factor RsiW